MIRKFQLNKNYLLIAGSILLCVISYELALKNTIDAWKLHRKLQSQISNATLSEQPAYLDRQNKALTSVINKYKADTVNYRNTLITQLSEIGDKEHVRIVEVPIQTNLSTSQYLIQKISIKGDFFNLLKTLNHLQKIADIGYVRSVLFKKNTDVNKAKEDKEIVLDLFLEGVK